LNKSTFSLSYTLCVNAAESHKTVSWLCNVLSTVTLKSSDDCLPLYSKSQENKLSPLHLVMSNNLYKSMVDIFILDPKNIQAKEVLYPCTLTAFFPLDAIYRAILIWKSCLSAQR